MSRDLLSLLLLSLLLISCDERALSPADGSPSSDGAVVSDSEVTGDTRPHADLPLKPDTSAPKDSGAPKFPWCTGSANARVDNKPHKVAQVESRTSVLASCCPAGEEISLVTLGPQGKQVKLNLEVSRFPNIKIQPKVDLGQPPKGWFYRVRCSPTDRCGILSANNALLSGYFTYKQILSDAGPAVDVTICLEAKPKTSAPPMPPNPYSKPVRLWTGKVRVHQACVWGMHQTCNQDKKVSSLRGKCNDNSTCTCNPGAKKVAATGKCL